MSDCLFCRMVAGEIPADVVEATRDKGRAVTDAVSQQASNLGAKLQGRSHDGTDERGPKESA